MKYKQNLRVDGNKVFSYDTHVATIDGGKLLVHGWWSVTTSKHINYVADVRRLDVVKNEPKESACKYEPKKPGGMFKTVAMVAAFGDILCGNQKEKNDWKARMLKAGLGNRGLSMPENWDQLSEDEKEKRLSGALGAIA